MNPESVDAWPMRAWQVAEHGSPTHVLHLATAVPAPIAGAHEVVIRVNACALNFADALLCTGEYQEHPPLPFTPGLELAGEVVAAGPDSAISVGARVAGSPSLPHGGLAEFALARDIDVFALPDTIDDVSAAASHVSYQTGWFALHHRGSIVAGETLLVHAGAGGVGSAAIELGVAAGATVIATAGGPDKVEQCRTRGAHHTIDHRSQDFVAVVNDITDGAGADVIFDPVGGDTFTRSTKCIAWQGRLLVIGAAAGTFAPARTNHALVKNYSIIGLNWRGYLTRRPDLVTRAHDELMALHAAGRITPLISETLNIGGDIAGALTRLTDGRTIGKLVVVP